MMRYGVYGYNIAGMIVFCFVMLFILALLVLGAVLIIRSLRRSGGQGGFQPGMHQDTQQQPGSRPHMSSALDILNERYAKGEISEEEYKKKKADILG